MQECNAESSSDLCREEIEYKYVVRGKGGVLEWQPGGNISLSLPVPGAALVQVVDDWHQETHEVQVDGAGGCCFTTLLCGTCADIAQAFTDSMAAVANIQELKLDNYSVPVLQSYSVPVLTGPSLLSSLCCNLPSETCLANTKPNKGGQACFLYPHAAVDFPLYFFQ